MKIIITDRGPLFLRDGHCHRYLIWCKTDDPYADDRFLEANDGGEVIEIVAQILGIQTERG